MGTLAGDVAGTVYRVYPSLHRQFRRPNLPKAEATSAAVRIILLPGIPRRPPRHGKTEKGTQGRASPACLRGQWARGAHAFLPTHTPARARGGAGAAGPPTPAGRAPGACAAGCGPRAGGA